MIKYRFFLCSMMAASLGCAQSQESSKEPLSPLQKNPSGFEVPQGEKGNPNGDEPGANLNPDPDPTPNPDPDPDPDPMPNPDPDPDPSPSEQIQSALYSGDTASNINWIGGACSSSVECEIDNGECLEDSAGFPGGLCTAECAQFCPDRGEATDVLSFCVPSEGGGGACVSRCDFELHIDGCREGYACLPAERENDPSTVKAACLPAPPNFSPPSACYAELLLEDNIIDTWNAPYASAAEQICWIEAPLRLESPVGGVDYRYYYDDSPGSVALSCSLAQALEALSELLSAKGIVEVVHIGTYNCRVISGTDILSRHSFGDAIDLRAFVHQDGTVYDVFDHWEHDTTAPLSEQGLFLYELSFDLASIFNIVLTPEYDSAHDNHFHVDLTPDADFLFSSVNGGTISKNFGH